MHQLKNIYSLSDSKHCIKCRALSGKAFTYYLNALVDCQLLDRSQTQIKGNRQRRTSLIRIIYIFSKVQNRSIVVYSLSRRVLSSVKVSPSLENFFSVSSRFFFCEVLSSRWHRKLPGSSRRSNSGASRKERTKRKSKVLIYNRTSLKLRSIQSRAAVTFLEFSSIDLGADLTQEWKWETGKFIAGFVYLIYLQYPLALLCVVRLRC